MPGTNTIAYFAPTSLAMKEKSFTTLTPDLAAEADQPLLGHQRILQSGRHPLALPRPSPASGSVQVRIIIETSLK